MYADILQRMVLQGPTPLASASALAVLQLLTRSGDFIASRALATALAIAMGYEQAAAKIAQKSGAAEALDDSEIPSLLRLYLVGLSPRVFLSETERCGAVASETCAEDEFHSFQRLVLREDPLQHEGMKAYLLTAFSKVRDGAMNLLSRAGEINVLDEILTRTTVVPGEAMDAGFSFGREKILALSREGLLFVLTHELGHHVFDWAMSSRGMGFPEAEQKTGANTEREALSPAQFAELARALPDLVESAQKGGKPPHTGTKLTNGLILLVSVVGCAGGPYLHLSLSHDGGPILMASAGYYAFLILRLIGAKPENAAAAMSPRGVFHFGVTGQGPDPAEIRHQLMTNDPTALLSDLHKGSEHWLSQLNDAARLTLNPEEISIGLGLTPRTMQYFVADESSAENLNILIKLRSNLSDLRLSPEALERAVSAAAGVGDNDLLRALLAAGRGKIRIDPQDIARAGASLGIADDGSAKHYFGSTPEEVLLVLETLRDHGGDLSCKLDASGTTLLIAAARRSPSVAAALLSLGADPNLGDAKNETPLHAAVHCEASSLIETLIAAGSAVDPPNLDGVTPLMAAVSLGNVSAVEVLLSYGANANAASSYGVTPLMMVSAPAVAQQLIRAGADLNARDSASQSPLISAATRGLPELVIALLKAGADPEAASAQGDTALHRVAGLPDSEAQEKCFDALFAAGADVDEETSGGITPLMVAAHSSSPGALRYLLRRGADVNARSGDGNTALLLACDPASQWTRSFTRLDRVKESIRILAEAKADMDAAGNDGATALHLATHFFDSTIVQCLLELDANPNACTELGSTPLMSAASEQHQAMVDLLIAAGADVNARDKSGNTALFHAIQGRPSSDYRAEDVANVVGTLLSHGANPNLQNVAGESVTTLAVRSQLPDPIKARIAEAAHAKRRTA